MKTTDSTVATRAVTTGDESLKSSTATRLDYWKDIANYLNRSVRTVQRWEMLEAMPVHRHCHTTGGSDYVYQEEVDAWRLSRSQRKRPALQVSAIRLAPMESLARAAFILTAAWLGCSICAPGKFLRRTRILNTWP
jgi:hypothetical protein